jgi:hypothetical protein
MSSVFRIRQAEIVLLKIANRLPDEEFRTFFFGAEGQFEQMRVDCFSNVTLSGYLISAISALDTFLSDTTQLLLLLQPNALGEKCLVPIGTLTSARARAKVINDEVRKKVRHVSYDSFQQRLEYLEEKFRLGLSIDEKVMWLLKRAANLRHNVVHDQALFGFLIDDSEHHSVVSKGKHPFKPVPVSDDDVDDALNAVNVVALTVYCSVRKTVLAAEDDEMTEALAKQLKRVDRSVNKGNAEAVPS